MDRLPKQVLAIILGYAAHVHGNVKGSPEAPIHAKRRAKVKQTSMGLPEMKASARRVAKFHMVSKQFNECLNCTACDSLWRKVASTLLDPGASLPQHLFFGGTWKKVAMLLVDKKREQLSALEAQCLVSSEWHAKVGFADCGMCDTRESPSRPPSEYTEVMGDRRHIEHAAQQLLEFLGATSLHTGEVHEFCAGALRRYRAFLALQGKHPNVWLVPTFDIEFAWLSHIFRTRAYWADMEALRLDGRHSLVLDEVRSRLFTGALQSTARLWRLEYAQEYVAEGVDLCFGNWRAQQMHQVDDLEGPWPEPRFRRAPCYFGATGAAPPETDSVAAVRLRLTAGDLVADCQWLPDLQRSVARVSLWRAGVESQRELIERLSASYDRLLFLVKKFPGRDLTPSLPVDLLWHAHQSDPVRYRQETTARLGFLLEHNPWPQGPGNSMPLSKDIEALWQQEFHVAHHEDFQHKEALLWE